MAVLLGCITLKSMFGFTLFLASILMISQFAYLNDIHLDPHQHKQPSLTFVNNITYDRFDMSECSWSHSNDIKGYKEKSKKTSSLITMGINILLKQTNFTFVLKAGSLLGAYRNGGFISGDDDLDIIIPIWMNLNVFNIPNMNYQDCHMANQMLSQTMGRISPNVLNKINNTELCGLDIDDWVKIVFDYFNVTFDSHSRTFQEYDSKVIGFKWVPYDTTSGKKGIRHDVWITINYNKWVSAHSNICLCKFDSMMVWCYEDSSVALAEHYGTDYMIPMTELNGTYVSNEELSKQRKEMFNWGNGAQHLINRNFRDINYTVQYLEKRFRNFKLK